MAGVDASVSGGKKKSWVKKAAIGLGVGAVVLLVGGYVLVPVIAGAKAPGLIESAAGGAIKGTVKVGSVSVGWGGPVVVRGLELRDPEGKLVGVFEVESSLGIWKVLGGIKDLGTTKVSGRVDIVRTTDAAGKVTTNLERAVESKIAAVKGSSGGGGGSLPEMAGRVDVSGFDATFEERDAKGGVVGRAAMKGLKGSVDFSTAGAGKIDVQLDAGFGEKLDGPATGSLAVKAAVTSFVGGGALAADKASVDATVEAKGAPVNLIDALAAQGGLLSGALGATADATVKVKGTAAAMNADVVLNAPNATADLGVKTEGAGAGSRLVATRKGNLNLRSLAFVEKMPSVAAGLKDAGVAVTKWPGVTVAVTSLDVPASGEGSWAGAKVELSAFTTGEVNGTIARPGADGKPGTPEALVVKPVMVGVIAPDVVKGVEVIGNTEATIGGQSAGALDLNVQVSDLIGADGKLVLAGGGVPGKLVGVLDAKAVATGLLAPFVAGSGLPIDLPVDVGPTLDMKVTASTKGGASAGSVPPTDIAVYVKSANVSVVSTMLFDATGLGLARETEPTKIVIERAAPLVQRVLAKGAKAGEALPVVTGAGRVEIELASARLPVSGKKIDTSLISATAKVTVTDLTVRTGAKAGEEPVSVGAERLMLGVTALPRTISPVKVDGRLTLNGQPMDVKSELKIAGLLEEQQLPRLAGLDTRRVSGFASLEGVSGVALQGIMLGSGSSAAMKRVAAELVGSSIAVRVEFGDKTNGGTQPVSVTVTGQGMNGVLQAELKPDSIEVARVEGGTTLTDALARGVLEVAGQTGEAVAGARLREPTAVSLRVQPLTVPLKAGTFTPEWGRAKSIVTVSAALARPAIVDGLRVDGRALSAGVANFSLDGSVPLSIMDDGPTHAPGAAGLRLSGSMDVVGNGEPDVLARLRISGGSGPQGDKPSVNVNLTDVVTARLDEIAGQGGLLPGLLGDRVSVTAVVSQPQAGQTELGMEVNSPQLTVKNAQFVMTKESYRAAGPFVVSLTAQPALIDQRVLGAKPGDTQAGSLHAGEPVKLTLNVAKCVFSASGADVGGGPLKPGVFDIDVVAVSPRIVLIRSGVGEPGAAGSTAARTTELSDFTGTLKSTGTASKTGVAFTASVGSVKSGGQVVTDPTVVRGTVDNLADVGGRVQADSAVINVKATTGRLPTPLIDSLANAGGRLTELLGDEVTADVDARDVSKTGASGFVDVKLKSPKASVVAGGPVSGGVLDTGAPGATPVRIELTDFKFSGGGSLLSVFPIFAEMNRAAGESNKGPAVIASRALRLPIDGDMSKLSGAIDIDIGRVDYEFSKAVGGLLDDTIFRGGRGQDQRPVPKFTIDIDKGVLRYGSVQQKVLLPVRNLDFNMRGVVDLVGKRIDVVTYIPTLAAAPGLVGNLNQTVGGALGKLVPGVVDKITSIPVRTQGPLDNPTTAYSPQIVLDEFKDVLKPENLLKGLGDLLGGGKDAPAPPPAKPAAPSKPAGPTAPKKK